MGYKSQCTIEESSHHLVELPKVFVNKKANSIQSSSVALSDRLPDIAHNYLKNVTSDYHQEGDMSSSDEQVIVEN